MPKITDKRITQGRKNRNSEIRNYFEKRFKEGLRFEIIEEEVILKWGISSSTILKILKEV